MQICYTVYDFMPASHHHNNAYVVSVNMGYGHERAAYGVRNLAHGGIITANSYEGIPAKDKKVWSESRRVYEMISRLKPIPFIGNIAFSLLDSLQRIEPFYPRRDLSRVTAQVRQTYYSIEHLGLCRHLIEKLSKRPLPLICTFFIPAFAAEEFDYPGDIYIIICDADISRAWVPRDPKKSRIKYFAPNGRVVERLKLYGVREDNIFLTGFPLPHELIGGADGDIVKKDLMNRLCRLDSNGIFLGKYSRTLDLDLAPGICLKPAKTPPTLTFCIGGAGAQKNLAITVLRSLSSSIKRKKLILRLVPGTSKQLAEDFAVEIERLGLRRSLNSGLFVDYFADRPDYFKTFSKILRTTDILWTKPSELSFYTGAGIPVVMAPSIGSQELFNRTWLKTVGGGVTQGDPRYVNEWLFDWIQSGGLARIAWNGYIEAPTHGAYRIENVITGEQTKLENLPLIV